MKKKPGEKPISIAHNRGYKTLIFPDVGTMLVDEEPDHWRVAAANVDPHLQRKGFGTKLYSEAFAQACREGKILRSDSFRSHIAEAFWRKQARKRRAVCMQRGRSPVYMAPLAAIASQFLAVCRRTLTEEQAKLCVKGRMKHYLETLPKPKTYPGYDEAGYWPCYQWALDPAKCGKALEGLAGLRRRR